MKVNLAYLFPLIFVPTIVLFQLNTKTPLLPMLLALLNLMVTFLPSNFAITSETLLLDFSSYSLAFVPHFLMFSV
jgi:hypothetical protein